MCVSKSIGIAYRLERNFVSNLSQVFTETRFEDVDLFSYASTLSVCTAEIKANSE